MTSQLPLGFEEQPPRRRPRRARSFHVRSHMTVEDVAAGEAKAQGQDALVLRQFKPGARLTPSDVQWLLTEHEPPPAPLLTSIRRSLTNLTKRGQLVHHPADRRPGPRGSKESTWSLA